MYAKNRGREELRGIAELIIAKQRGGATGKCNMVFIGARQRLEAPAGKGSHRISPPSSCGAVFPITDTDLTGGTAFSAQSAARGRVRFRAVHNAARRSECASADSHSSLVGVKQMLNAMAFLLNGPNC
jgi:hypothetical protein